MNRSLFESDSFPRERVALVLAFLSSPTCQEACHRVLDPERLAYEWCRVWFDEVYVPSLRYLDGLKGDRSEEDVAAFWDAFSDEEKEVLERFHRFLELRVDMLSEEVHRRASFPQSDAWDSIVRHAEYVLEDLQSVDRLRLQNRIGALVRLLVRRTEERQEASETFLLSSLNDALQRPRLPE